MKTIARLVLLLFHPLLVPLFGSVMMLSLSINYTYLSVNYIRFVLLTLLLTTVILPLFILPLLRMVNVIHDLAAETRRDQVFILCIMATLFFLTFMLFKKVHMPLLLQYYPVALSICSIALCISLFMYTLNLQMAGMGFLTGISIFLSIHLKVNLTLVLIGIIAAAGISGSLIASVTEELAGLYRGFLSGMMCAYLSLFLLF